MMTQLVKDLPQSDQMILNKCIQHNAFFAHSENILLTMLTDSNQAIRKKAVIKILDIRSQNVCSDVDEKDGESSDVSPDADLDESDDELKISSDCDEDGEQAHEDEVPAMYPVRPFKVPKLKFRVHPMLT